MTVYTWRRDTAEQLAIDVVEGSVTGDETVRAVLKRARAGDLPPGDDAPEALVLSVAFVAAAGENPAHWILTATADQTRSLAAGRYVADARIVVAGGHVVRAAPIVINLLESVTRASA